MNVSNYSNSTIINNDNFAVEFLQLSFLIIVALVPICICKVGTHIYSKYNHKVYHQTLS